MYKRQGEGTLVYYAFDLLYLERHDLRSLPLLRRKQLLAQILPDLPRIKYSDHVRGQGVAFFRQAAESGLEGVIAKDGQSAYQAGKRSEAWQKFKARPCQEAVIGGFTAPRSGRQFFGSLLLGVYEGDDLVYVGHTGTGFDQETLAELRARQPQLETEASRPDLWDDPDRARQVTGELASVTDDLEIYDGLGSRIDDIEVLRAIAVIFVCIEHMHMNLFAWVGGPLQLSTIQY